MPRSYEHGTALQGYGGEYPPPYHDDGFQQNVHIVAADGAKEGVFHMCNGRAPVLCTAAVLRFLAWNTVIV